MQPSMTAANMPPCACALKLADHLECTIAACTELVSQAPYHMNHVGEDDARRVELTAITHLLQARDCARETASRDWRLAECVQLFIAGTQALEQSAAIQSHEPLLGRRLAVSTAVQFATLMLKAFDGAYRAPQANGPAIDDEEAEAQRAAA